MHAFVQARTAERGLMRLVFGCWRERVEHDAPGINSDMSRWRVRRRWKAGRMTRSRQQQRGQQPSMERVFAQQQLHDFDKVAHEFQWNPWRTRKEEQDAARESTHAQKRRANTENETMTAQWRLRCDLLRVATYYRVTGSQRKAERRRRAGAAKDRFRRWAATVVAARRQQSDAESAGSGDDNQLRK